jgi:hypothetical protein
MSGGLGLGCLGLCGGCSDESKTTGTQLQLTPEDREVLKGAMKGRRAAQQEERAEAAKNRR